MVAPLTKDNNNKKSSFSTFSRLSSFRFLLTVETGWNSQNHNCSWEIQKYISHSDFRCKWRSSKHTQIESDFFIDRQFQIPMICFASIKHFLSRLSLIDEAKSNK